MTTKVRNAGREEWGGGESLIQNTMINADEGEQGALLDLWRPDLVCWIPGREAWIRDLKVALSLPSRECKMIDRLSGMPDENSKSWRVTYIDIPSRPTGWALTK